MQIGLGWRMDGPPGPQSFAIYQLHKSIGITILPLTLVRLGWRLGHPAPAFPATMSRLERALAHGVHVTFYLLLLSLPLSGWLMVSASRLGVPTYLFGTISWPHVPGIAALPATTKAVVESTADTGHTLLVYLAYMMLFLHIAGALKHQFVDRGGDLARMLPVKRTLLAPGAIAVLAIVTGLAGLGRTLQPGPIARAQPPSVTAPRPSSTVPVAEPQELEGSATARTAEGDLSNAAAAADDEDVAAAEPSAWTVRKSSTLRFTTRWSQGVVEGRFASWTATIKFSPEALDKSSVKVTIDMASARTGEADTESALPGDDWFAVSSHPTATYTASKFVRLDGDRYRADGTLSLRGISRPLSLPFRLTIDGDVATMNGTATIDRTLFGVGQGEWKATSDVPANVTVQVSLSANRERDQ